jgi:hypothetical protein
LFSFSTERLVKLKSKLEGILKNEFMSAKKASIHAKYINQRGVKEKKEQKIKKKS